MLGTANIALATKTATQPHLFHSTLKKDVFGTRLAGLYVGLRRSHVSIVLKSRTRRGKRRMSKVVNSGDAITRSLELSNSVENSGTALFRKAGSMLCMVLNVPFTLPPLPNRKLSLSSTRDIAKSSSWGWNSSFPSLQLTVPDYQCFQLKRKPLTVVQAAWTRRSKSESAKNPRKKSWKQRTDKYMRPFLLDVFISNRYIHAKVMHRVTSKVVSVATTNSKELRNSLPSLTDLDACRTIGKLIAEQSKEADVYAISYEPRKGERVEGKLGIILDTIKENDIAFV